MAITQKSMKILWAEAAGRCSFGDCRERLCFSEAEGFAPYTLGEMAHIRGDRPGSNRHDVNQTPEQRDSYENLILLCPTHHTLIDRPENEAHFSVDMLLCMKGEHERFVAERLDGNIKRSKEEICAEVTPLLADSKVVWEQYGPFSEIARRNPHSDGAYAAWLSERLSTIVPNNRKIARLIEQYRNRFAPGDQAAISRFLVHARSYEQWVQDEINYEAVVRFPLDFEQMIIGGSNAGA